MSKPKPLTPADCDLRAYDWFPFAFKRFRGSAFWKRASDAACRISIELWCEAYQQVPSGSLPDDDVQLSEWAGFGRRDLTSWLEVKAEVMEPWVMCSDGRWYHPVVCEVALTAWADRVKHLKSREYERNRKKTYRDRLADVPGDTTGTSEESPAENALIEREIGTGRTEEGEPKGSLSSSKPTTADVKAAFDAYNEMAARVGLPLAKLLDKGRKTAIAARLAEHKMAGWMIALAAVERSPHCRGENDRSWKADLDFICQPKSWRRITEGSYGGGEAAGQPMANAPVWTGPPDIMAIVMSHQDHKRLGAYLDACAWRPGPTKAVLASNGHIAAALRQAFGNVFADQGVTVLHVAKAAA